MISRRTVSQEIAFWRTQSCKWRRECQSIPTETKKHFRPFLDQNPPFELRPPTTACFPNDQSSATTPSSDKRRTSRRRRISDGREQRNSGLTSCAIRPQPFEVRRFFPDRRENFSLLAQPISGSVEPRLKDRRGAMRCSERLSVGWVP